MISSSPNISNVRFGNKYELVYIINNVPKPGPQDLLNDSFLETLKDQSNSEFKKKSVENFLAKIGVNIHNIGFNIGCIEDNENNSIMLFRHDKEVKMTKALLSEKDESLKRIRNFIINKMGKEAAIKIQDRIKKEIKQANITDPNIKEEMKAKIEKEVKEAKNKEKSIHLNTLELVQQLLPNEIQTGKIQSKSYLFTGKDATNYVKIQKIKDMISVTIKDQEKCKLLTSILSIAQNNIQKDETRFLLLRGSQNNTNPIFSKLKFFKNIHELSTYLKNPKYCLQNIPKIR